MSNLWFYKYNNDTIVVKNTDSSELLINDISQDKQYGISLSTELNGKLDNEMPVKAILTGLFPPKCELFVNNVLIEPITTIQQ
jgi:hypothetical protein